MKFHVVRVPTALTLSASMIGCHHLVIFVLVAKI